MTRTPIGRRQRLNFYFDSQVFEAMKQLAELKGTTFSELLREAARQYVIREADKARAGAATIKELAT